MKKLLLILLILATMCLFLVSCNGKIDTDTSKDTTQITDTSSGILNNTDSEIANDSYVDTDTNVDTNTDTNVDTSTDTNVDTSTDADSDQINDTNNDSSINTDSETDSNEVSDTTTDSSENSDTPDTEKVYAPNIRLLDYDGNEVTLEDFRGKVVVLNFFASWCPPCRNEMPDFEDAYKKYGSEVEFVMVSHLAWGSDTVESAKSFYNQSGYTFPIYFDYLYDGYYEYELQSIPRTVIINSDGTVSAYYTGMISAQILENAIQNAK